MLGHNARRLAVGTIAGLALLLAWAATASAAPLNDVTAIGNSTAAPGGAYVLYSLVYNVGDEPTPDLEDFDFNGVPDGDGQADDPYAVTITLPPEIVATSFSGFGFDCSATTFPSSTVSCISTEVLQPGGFTRLILTTTVDPGATEGDVLTASIEASGGGAANTASTLKTVRISSTPPEFGIDAFDGQVTANAAGDPFSQAGGHPYAISTAILFNTITNPIPIKGVGWPVEPVKNILVDLPPGLVGDPTATGDLRCTLAKLANSESINAKPLCAPGAQVGVTRVITSNGLLLGNKLPVFNMVTPPGVPARFGINVSGTVVTLDAALRTGGDYGLSVNVRNVAQGLAIAGTSLTFWGVPADPSHDAERACTGQLAPGDGGPSCTTELPRRPFLRNPTSCTAPGVGLTTTLSIDSWVDPGDFRSASFVSHDPPAFPADPAVWGSHQGTTGCGEVPFAPSLAGGPIDSAAGAGSGYAFDLTLPQSDDPDAIATADLKKAVVTLPEGVRVSPSAASGLGACAPANIGLDSAADPSCPGTSKIGTVTITTPVLDEPLTGSIYLATQNDNPFKSLLSVYLVAKGPGLLVKLPGHITTDAATGQLTATFDNNPQLPFSNLHLEFKGGRRASLVNPPKCGTYTTHAVLTSWSGKTVISNSQFSISKDGNGTPCGAPKFTPGFSAGVDSVGAGKHTTFNMRLTRDDDDEEIRSLGVRTPTGLLAKIAGVPLCNADVEGKAGTCGEASRIGDVVTGAGPGSEPFYLPGRVYLTGPYNNGPFGLSIVVPAVAGPFNLGTVVVRASIRIDKRTSQLRVISDPLPTILEGIPLQVRDVRVAITRKAFMINPTSCLQKQVTASVTSTEGSRATVADRFQVGGCSKLSLRPRMRLAVGAKGRTQIRRSTPLTATLTQRPGQSNLKSVAVTLPLTLNALLPVVNAACTQAEFDVGKCEESRTGSAVAVTPLLDKPLKGSAYFVKKPGGGLPNLVVALRGQVDFDLVGTITIPGGTRLATTFASVPDVPVRSFKLSLVAGKDGAVGVAENLCTPKSKRAKAAIEFTGQNGRVIRASQRLKISGCRK